MKYILFFIALLGSLIMTVSAQETTSTDSIDIPEIIKQNCLLTTQNTIDYCPAYRQVLSTTNRSLANERNTLLGSGGISLLISHLDKNIANQTKDKLTLVRTKPSVSDLFMAEYNMYINNLFRHYLEQNSDSSQIVSSFFKTTYFDRDQSGLGIDKIELFRGIPAQYDTTLMLNITVRNYSIMTIDTVEGIYCFSTINGQDYIYPITVTNAFNKNSITNIIAPVSVKNSPLLDQYGAKNLYCTLVYTDQDTERYTNRSHLSFSMKQ